MKSSLQTKSRTERCWPSLPDNKGWWSYTTAALFPQAVTSGSLWSSDRRRVENGRLWGEMGGISTCIFFLHSWQFFFSAFLWSGAPHLRWGLCWGQVHVVSVLDVQEYESLLRGFVAFEEDWKWTLERINTKIDFFFFFSGYSSFWIFSSKQLKIFAESLNRPWTLYLFTVADGAESVDCGWLASKSRLSQMSQTSQTRIRAGGWGVYGGLLTCF